ncbi:MAG TPA: hypothetical protein VG734_02185 [Lacunisphaera sp.]|nr:hypothetical protein [Lacunisphaera sp.]
MNSQALKASVCGLLVLACMFALDLPACMLPGWTPLGRLALDSAGQLAAYAALAALAVAAEPLTGGKTIPPQIL